MKTTLFNNLYENLGFNENLNRYTTDLGIIYDEYYTSIEIDIEGYMQGFIEERETSYSDFIYYTETTLAEPLTFFDAVDEMENLKQDLKVLHKMINNFIKQLLKAAAKTDEHINIIINEMFN